MMTQTTVGTTDGVTHTGRREHGFTAKDRAALVEGPLEARALKYITLHTSEGVTVIPADKIAWVNFEEAPE